MSHHDVLEATPPRTAAQWFYRAPFQCALVVAVTAVVVLWQLGLETLDNHEAKTAIAARGMLRSDEWITPGSTSAAIPPNTPVNHWLVPLRNGRPRLVKTPLQYWCIAGSSVLLGDRETSEFSARLPSAIAAVLCALVTLALGRRMFGPRAALLAALMLATSVGLAKWGRNARPDMLLCLATTTAMACFYLAVTAKANARRAGWMLAFWAAMGLANLAKQFMPLLLAAPLMAYLFWRQDDLSHQAAPSSPGRTTTRRALAKFCIAAAAAIVVCLVILNIDGLHWWRHVGIGARAGKGLTMALAVTTPLAWYMWRSGGWRQILPLLPTALPGVVIMLALFVPWLLYIANLFGQAGTISEQVIGRVEGIGKKWHVDPSSKYLKGIVTFTLPWVVFLPGALIVPWLERFKAKRGALVYLFLCVVGFVAMLTLSAGKRDHYVLPIVPAICLLMGFVAEDVIFNHRWIRPALAKLLLIAYAAAGPAAVAIVAVICLRTGAPPTWLHALAISAIAAAPCLGAFALALRNRFAPAFVLVLLAMVLVYLGYYTRGDLWDNRRPAARFAQEAARIVGPRAPVANWADPQAKTVYYFGRNIRNAHWELERLQRQLPKEQAGTRWNQWIKDPRNVQWFFSYGRYVDMIKPLGYEVVYEVRGRQRKRLLFTLLRNTRAEPAAGDGK